MHQGDKGAEQRQSGKLLGRVLLELGLVAHADLLAAVAMQQGIEVAGSARTARAVGATQAARPSGAPVPELPGGKSKSRRAILAWAAVALALAALLGIATAYRSSSITTNSSASPR